MRDPAAGPGTGETQPRGADESLFEILADLEARAGALHHRERAEEVADRSRSAYAEVDLASRLMASLGHRVTCEVRSVGRLAGRLGRVGRGWFHLEGERSGWSVPTAALLTVRGLSPRSIPEQAWAPTDRLALGSWLRRLAEERSPVRVHLDDGIRREGVLLRVGADFLEMGAGGEVEVLALDAVVALNTPT